MLMLGAVKPDVTGQDALFLNGGVNKGVEKIAAILCKIRYLSNKTRWF